MPALSPFRNVAALFAVILGSLALTLSVAVVWMHEVVIDSNRYVNTVAPLAGDAAVKDAVAQYATDDLFSQMDIEQMASDSLPDSGDLFVGPATGAAKGAVYQQIRDQLDTPQFAKVWQDANREAHSAFLQMMRGSNRVTPGEEGKILIDVSQVFSLVKSSLSVAGFTFLDNVEVQAGHRFTIFQFPALARARSAFNLLDEAALWLPASAVILLGAGIWLAANRRFALAAAGLSVALFTATLFLGLDSIREYYLSAVTARGDIDVPAATSFYDIMTGPLRSLVQYAFAAGLVVAAAALIMPVLFSSRGRSGRT